MIASENLRLNVTVEDDRGHVEAGEDVVDPGAVVGAPTVHLGVPASEGLSSVWMEDSECINKLVTWNNNISSCPLLFFFSIMIVIVLELALSVWFCICVSFEKVTEKPPAGIILEPIIWVAVVNLPVADVDIPAHHHHVPRLSQSVGSDVQRLVESLFVAHPVQLLRVGSGTVHVDDDQVLVVAHSVPGHHTPALGVQTPQLLTAELLPQAAHPGADVTSVPGPGQTGLRRDGRDGHPAEGGHSAVARPQA